jgi:hypothetical protein
MNVAERNDFLRKAIIDFEEGIKNIPKEGWLPYLQQRHINAGICWWIHRKFDIEFKQDFIFNISIKLNGSNRSYWFTPAEHWENRKEVIESLQKRVNVMKAIIAGEEITAKKFGGEMRL